jgi:hypothetical protein
MTNSETQSKILVFADIGAGLDPAISSTLLLGLVATAATSVLLL